MKKLSKKDLNKLQEFSFLVKEGILDISYRAKTGHIGSALSIADLVAVLYAIRMNISRSTIQSNTRDRFILSKGHAAAALYAALYYKKILTKKEFLSFGHEEGGLCEHPEIWDPGVEMSAGSLGHGLSFAVGIALGMKRLRIQNTVFVLISDGECGEGSIWEAAQLAATLKLDNLVVIVDFNNWQCFGRSTQILALEPFQQKWEAFGFAARTINGHNLTEIVDAYQAVPFRKQKPSIIIARTISGKGVRLFEDQISAHYKVLNEAEYLEAKLEIQV